MRFSKLLGKTLRQPPSDARLPSHQLLVRAGYVRGVEVGLFAWLPLGTRVLSRLQRLVRQELARLGGQDVDLPHLPSAAPMPALARLVGREVDSYRQLPVLIAHWTTCATDQGRARGGLLAARERPCVEIHAFGSAELSDVEGEVESALDRVLAACDVPVLRASVGDEDGGIFFPHSGGDEEIVRCPGCGYAAERSWATTAWPSAPDEAELPPEEIETPGCDTIAALAEFLQIAAQRTLKMVFYSVDGRVTCIVIRGDRAVDEQKLARVLGTDQYYASTEDELAAIGAIGGYASPIGLDPRRVRVVADPSVRAGRNFVSGANRPDYHIRNVNVPRDFSPDEWAELALVEAGDACPQCGTALGVETAFALAHRVAPEPCQPEAEYLDAEGQGHPLWVASWRLDLARLLAAVVEAHHDDYGILWPVACAPYDVHLVALDVRKEAVAAQAGALYDRLQAEGLAVLYDDREASAGVKFNDADLIGLPLRLTVSSRSANEGTIEGKWRHSRERLTLDEEGLAAELARLG